MKNEKTQTNQYPASQYHPTSKKEKAKKNGMRRCNATRLKKDEIKMKKKKKRMRGEKKKEKKESELVRNRLSPQHAQFLQFRPSMMHIRSLFEHRP